MNITTKFEAQPVKGIDDKYYYFYRINNKLNGKFYYGVHETYKINDWYHGSGKSINIAYKKYGIENFEKIIKRFFKNKYDMYQYEKEIVNEKLVNDSNCYNLTTGGEIPLNRKNIKSLKLVNGKWVGVSYGNIWIKKENMCIKIPGENLQEYLDDGWQKGRIIYNYVKPKINKMYWINDSKNNKKVKQEDLQEYLDNGWKRGKTSNTNCKDTIWISRNNKCKQVKQEDLQKYLDNGWKRGMGEKSRKNHIYIHKLDELKDIHERELQKYLNDGWQLGRYEEKRFHVNKDGVNKMSSESELQKYLDDGWQLGSDQRDCSDTIWINNGQDRKRVKLSDLQKYLDDEWKKGYKIIKK